MRTIVSQHSLSREVSAHALSEKISMYVAYVQIVGAYDRQRRPNHAVDDSVQQHVNYRSPGRDVTSFTLARLQMLLRRF